jgi:glycosyltransferase involved in cell wall biosynthesis
MKEEKAYPLVSIAIITFNQKSYLRECIDSCLAQDYPNIEIVIADDCSTDGTQDMLCEYDVKFPGKFVLRLSDRNQGITGNSNLCVDACRGKYIALTGGDDLFYPLKISKQVKILENNKSISICGTYTILIDKDGFKIDERVDIKNKNNPLYSQCELIESANSIVPVVSYMIRSSDVPNERFDFRLPVASDSLFYYRVTEKGWVYIIKEFLTAYRVHQSHARKIGYSDDWYVSLALVEYYYPNCLDAIGVARAGKYYSLGRALASDGNFKVAGQYLKNSLKLKFNFKTVVALMFSLLGVKR